MSLLFKRTSRQDAVNFVQVRDIVEEALNIAEEFDITFEQAMMAIREAREDTFDQFLRKDLEIKDEQLAGFGLLFRELIATLEKKL